MSADTGRVTDTKEGCLDLGNYQSSTSNRTKVRRLLWSVAYHLLFKPSPRFMFAWRRALLQCFGAKLHSKSYVYPTTKIWDPAMLRMGMHSAMDEEVDCYCIVEIRIGDNCTISKGALLCTGSHDISNPRMPLIARPIAICDGAWICARAFVGPGTTIHEGAVVAACAVVTKDVESWVVVGGNPASKIKDRKLTQRIQD